MKAGTFITITEARKEMNEAFEACMSATTSATHCLYFGRMLLWGSIFTRANEYDRTELNGLEKRALAWREGGKK